MPNTFCYYAMSSDCDWWMQGWEKFWEANGRVGKLGSAKFLDEWEELKPATFFFSDPQNRFS